MNNPKRIAVIGAGSMARMRGGALKQAGAEIVGVASRSEESAAKLTAELGGEAFGDYNQLESLKPDGVLVEVPHDVQDDITLAAISWGGGVLVGAPLASSPASASKIFESAKAASVPVEAGFHARYSPDWVAARKLVQEGALGDIIAVQSTALYQGNPERWNYRQAESGGMPLMLMTFFYLNPLRWILGDPVDVRALANRKKHSAEGLLDQETCSALAMFENDVLCTMLAGVVNHEERPRASVYILGTEGAMELSPLGMGRGTLSVFKDGATETQNFSDPLQGFAAQASAFLQALDGAATLRNTAEDARRDIHFANAIAKSAKRAGAVHLAE